MFWQVLGQKDHAESRYSKTHVSMEQEGDSCRVTWVVVSFLFCWPMKEMPGLFLFNAHVARAAVEGLGPNYSQTRACEVLIR